MLVVFFACLWLLLSTFFFKDTPTTQIYTLSLHDALPILHEAMHARLDNAGVQYDPASAAKHERFCRSEEHTSELQSHSDLVCRLLLEKKKTWFTSRLTWGKI